MKRRSPKGGVWWEMVKHEENKRMILLFQFMPIIEHTKGEFCL